MRHLFGSNRLPLLLVTAAALALGTPRARAQSAHVVPSTAAGSEALFGVAPGSASADLQALARLHGADCRAAAPVTTGAPGRTALPIVCAAPPVAPPVSLTATYWYEDDLLARAFLVASTPSSDIADDRRQFNLLHGWLLRALGPPTAPLQLPPGWSGGAQLSDADQMTQLLMGRARLSMSWQLPNGTVELWLAGERGRPVLAVGLRANAARPTCSAVVVNEALLDLFPPALPEARARAAVRLEACHVTRAAGALRAMLAHDDAPEVQAEALRALDGLGAAPSKDELARLAQKAKPPVVAAARAAMAHAVRAPAAPPAPPVAKAPPAVATTPEFGPPLPTPARAPVAAVEARDKTEATPEAPRAVPPAPEPPTPVAAGPVIPLEPPPPPAPSGPIPGTPLAIGASTVAGAALMRNISLWGQLGGTTPQLLLGSAGAVIGFGTSWGLSRFGFRPTIEQAAWFTNATAWGTLEGVAIWGVTGSSSPTLKYGLPVIGEAVGMAAGTWSAMKWSWTGSQLVLADSLVLGAGLTSLGVGLLQTARPQLTVTDAVGGAAVMVGAAIASRYLSPTENDVGLMMSSALAGGWTGGLLASGLAGTDFLGSHQSWGGVATGLGLGYLGGAAAGAFTESTSAQLGLGAGGMLAGNLLGLGLHLTVQGFARADIAGATFTPGEVDARATSAAVGGMLLGGAAYAYAPHLHLGPSATSLTITGALYGAGTWWLASAASYHGQPTTAIDDARLNGGLLTGAVLGGVSGLVASRWFAPDAGDEATAALGAGLGTGAGLGLAKLTTDTKGTPDAVGVLLGTGVGLAGGALASRALQLRPVDLGGGALGLGTGLLVGELLPGLGSPTWTDSRATAGSTLLGMSLGAGAGVGWAHATGATARELGVVTTAESLGLLAGLGLGYAQPCPAPSACTSQAPRVGALTGELAFMGGAMALEPRLHLATTLGPDAGTLGALGGAFGLADGLMLAGALAPDGVVSGAQARQAWGGMLFGASLEASAGLVASKYVRLNDGDGFVLAGGKLAGGLVGLGTAFLVRDQTGAGDTLATLGGSLGGLAAAAVAQAYTPLDATDEGAGATGAAFGAFVGGLAPTLTAPHWEGLDHRGAGGGVLLGLGAGAIGGAALGHATDATPRTVGLSILGGADGLATGLGLGLLASGGSSTRPQRIGLVAGTTAGIAVGALAWPRVTLGPGDAALITAASGLGAWTGLWVPALGHADASAVSAATRTGGVLAGAGLASFGSSLLAPVLDVDGDQLMNALALDALWTGAGVGAGALLSTRDDAPVWGMLGAGTAGLVFGGALHRSLELDATAAPYLALAGGEGLWLGGWLPSLFDEPTSRQRTGALALGGFGALGLATVLSPVVHPDGDLVADAAAVDALWTGAGAGAGALLSTSDKAPVWGMLGAGVAGVAVGGALHRSIDLGGDDVPLLGLAGGEGLWLGGWLPSLFDEPTGRQREGALALGGFGALGFATVLSPVVHPSADLAEDAAAVDALWTGAGAGAGALLSTSDKAPVWGMLGAGVAGLAVGGALHDALELGADDAPLIGLAGGEGLWLGGWLPSLFDQPTGRQRAGALALGGFGSLGVATVLSPVLHLDGDVAADAAAVDALWTGAGAGAGALLSTSDKAPVWGMLGAGVAGLAVGGALHRSIEIDDADAPLLTLAGAEGLWLGGWFPYALHARAQVTERERFGALALGGFGGVGLATIASGALEVSAERGGIAALGSGLAASMAGGLALLSPSLHDQPGVGLMLGGTTLGLAAGAAIAPRLAAEPGERLTGGAALGAGLGVSESLLFAWSGHASGSDQYGGAALFGGGLGASLGLAAAMTPTNEHGSAPAAAGFAAWGAWTGAFAGSLFKNDGHDDVMGGLIGANAGFLAGYALLRSELVDPRDFGWLSLFGALGTVAGAGAGAPFSSGSSTPVRAGLAIGPAAGMVVGALVLPRLHRSMAPAGTTALADGTPVGSDASAPAREEIALADDAGVAPSARASAVEPASLSRRLSQVGAVTDWAPLVGALPATPDSGPAPVLFGVTGHWK